ncbi:MAG: response regulator [Proteobacteria bacterium]|nr:response regulator [Pseudomonadota bacterium]MBU1649215.1 response regulator [Pseudomonadota bacterium]
MNKKIRILVVDDSATQAEHLRYVLEGCDYEVEVAKNGREALSSLSAHIPTLIISDIIMPEIDGFELCTRIKADEKISHIPVILLTTLSEPEDVLRGLESGADQFMTKPFNETNITKHIEQVLVNVEKEKAIPTDSGLEIAFAGRKYLITPRRIHQMLDLLLSIYDDTINKNRELENTIRALTEAKEEVKTLSGFIPICATCKKIRDDAGYWQQVESYVSEHSEAMFSHSICPDCAKKAYEDINKYFNKKA